MPTRSRHLFVLGVLVSLCGCSTTRMKTPVQQEHLEVTASAALDVPGYFIAPRLDLQGTLGLFDIMDVSAHAGTSLLFNYTLGTGVRVYPATWLTLGGAVDFNSGVVDQNFDPNQPSDGFNIENAERQLAITARAGFNHTTDSFTLSAGPQVMLSVTPNYVYNAQSDFYEEDGLAASAGSMGIFGSIEAGVGESGGVQAELSLWPSWFDTGFGPPPSTSAAIFRGIQIGIAYNYHFKGFVDGANYVETNARAIPSAPEPEAAPASKAPPKPDPPKATPVPIIKPPTPEAPAEPDTTPQPSPVPEDTP